ncbi:hypothetical protein GCM10011495_26000 [Hymenobacter frigidus]|uniref:Fibronectin type III-like domain-containing protein n=1 Tax=Hymenobacter frigidus TaxID=1524095 RepID=A0ABQ2AB00_9BACT|nr:fibronectin type III-like domain-contianing protein [Hymenobacter frigidus]GGH87334.1 hypothetical protein GCM10011495_26000 [Hymenobacter frigidus]
MPEIHRLSKGAAEKGERKTLTSRLSPNDLKFYNNDLNFVAEPGDFQVVVNGNPRELPMVSFKLAAK